MKYPTGHIRRTPSGDWAGELRDQLGCVIHLRGELASDDQGTMLRITGNMTLPPQMGIAEVDG